MFPHQQKELSDRKARQLCGLPEAEPPRPYLFKKPQKPHLAGDLLRLPGAMPKGFFGKLDLTLRGFADPLAMDPSIDPRAPVLPRSRLPPTQGGFAAPQIASARSGPTSGPSVLYGYNGSASVDDGSASGDDRAPSAVLVLSCTDDGPLSARNDFSSADDGSSTRDDGNGTRSTEFCLRSMVRCPGTTVQRLGTMKMGRARRNFVRGR